MENYPKTPDCMLDPREIIRGYLKAKYNEYIAKQKMNDTKSLRKLVRGKSVGIFEDMRNLQLNSFH